MDLSKFNDKKKTLINANILTSISLIIPCLLHSIRISKPNKRIHLTLSLSLSTFGVQAFVSLFVSVCCSSSTIVPSCCQKGKKKIALTCCECSVSIMSALSLRLVVKPLSLHLLLLHHCSRLPPPKKKNRSH